MSPPLSSGAGPAPRLEREADILRRMRPGRPGPATREARACLAAVLLGLAAGLFFGGTGQAHAGEYAVEATPVTDLKAVFGRVESYEVTPARARIGGTVLSLSVAAGSAVKTGEVLAVVGDQKLALQMQAIDARLKGLEAQLENARAEYERGRSLLARGITPQARVDQLKTAVDVLVNQIEAAKAERAVVEQQTSEGQVLAPRDGRVLTVPVTRGSVIMPGEPVAQIATGGYFLRLALPERHAAEIKQGDPVEVGPRGMSPGAAATPVEVRTGRIAKVYPELDKGRVIADVEVEGLGDFFVGERVLVWIPVGRRKAIVVPPEAVTTRAGVDYVRVATADGPADVPVIVGPPRDTAQGPRVEILSGLNAGDRVILP